MSSSPGSQRSSLGASAPELPDPVRYWSGRVTAEDVAQTRSKYAALRELAGVAEPERRSALRAVADRWPGALRESELVHPDEVERRRVAAIHLAVGEPRQGGASAREAAVLWTSLHQLLADQRALRTGAHDVRLACVERLVAVDEARSRRSGEPRRWPDVAVLIAIAGPKVRPRQAYLWLAAQAGESLPALHQRLFCRSGHWDIRPDDPPWSQSGVLSR